MLFALHVEWSSSTKRSEIQMGLAKQLKDLSKEYLKDPKGQFFRQLDNVLGLYKRSHVSKEEVIEHLEQWIDERKKKE